MMLRLFLVFLLIITSKLFGYEVYMKESPRALLMGGSYLALADDDHALFYNPALLGRNKGIAFHPLNIGFGASFDLDDQDRFDDVPDTPEGVASTFMNYPVHVSFGSAPGMKVGTWGFSLIYNTQANFLVYNQVHPFLEIDYGYDKGFVTGFAVPMGDEKTGQLSIGASVKYIKREGIFNQFSLLDTEIITAIEDSDDFDTIAEALGMGEDKSWGFDLGIDYIHKQDHGTFMAGLSILDAVETKFKDDSNPNAGLSDQPMTVNVGVGYAMDFGPLLDVVFTADLSPINRGYSWEQQVRFGIEVDLPSIDIHWGYNDAGFSYGLEVDFWVTSIFAGLYKSNTGRGDFAISSERALIFVSILDFSYDG